MRVSHVLDAVPVPIAHVDRGGVITSVNQMWTSRFSAGAGASCFDLWPAASDALRLLLRRETSEASFEGALSVDGGVDDVQVTARPCDDDDAAGVLITIAEVSGASKVSSQLARLRSQLSIVCDSVAEGIVAIDADADGVFTIRAANTRAATLTGLTDTSVLNRPLKEVVPLESALRLTERCAEAVRTRRVVRWRATAEYPSGTIHVDVTLTPVIDESGDCRRLIAVIRDETEFARQQRALADVATQAALQYRSFNAAVKSISDFVYVLDPEGRFTYGSPRLLDLLQMSEHELIGKDLYDIGYPAETAEQLLEHIAQVVETAQPVRGEVPFETAAGTRGYYEYIFHPVHGAGGNVDFIAGATRDVTERKLAEQALLTRAAEERAAAARLQVERQWLVQAQAVAKIGSWILNLETGALSWSDESYRICDVDPGTEENLYATFLDRVHPDERVALEESFARAIETRQPFDSVHRLITRDGTTKWIHERCEFTLAEDGRPLVAVGTTKDITERKAAEAELRESQQLLRIACRVGQIGGWHVDLSTLTVSWSDEVCAIHGVPPGFRPRVEDAIEFYAPEYRQAIQDAVATCIAEGTPYDLELQIITAQGERRWVRSIGEAAFDQHGTVTSIRGGFQDISDRKEAVEALRESDERFRLVAQATSDVVWDWDPVNDVLWWSDDLQSQFGYTREEARAADFWRSNIHPDDRERVTRGFYAGLSAGHLWRDEYRFRRADGTYAQVVDRCHLARAADGTAVRAVGAIVDVTEQRALQSQLEQVQRVSQLGQLAANMAHEFNNVLMGIQPFVELIRRATPENARVQDSTTRIMQSVQRGKKVTDEILRFTRRIEPTFTTLDVRQWLMEFLPEATAIAGTNLQIELQLPEQPLELDGDVAQLNQVLTNLVANARDASATGTRLIISAAPARAANDAPDARMQWLEVRVQDFGTGMTPSVLEQMFEPLFTTKRNGTGLGLAISQQVVAKHGGTITAESEPGRGTTFRILLPLRRSDTASPPVRRSDGTLPRTVVIVDDEPAVAEGIALLLAGASIETRIVSEGRRAIAAIARRIPELVLLDISLGDVSGAEVFQQIRERWPSLPVVLISGHYSRADLTEILALPGTAFVQKPFAVDEVLNAIRLSAPAAATSA